MAGLSPFGRLLPFTLLALGFLPSGGLPCFDTLILEGFPYCLFCEDPIYGSSSYNVSRVHYSFFNEDLFLYCLIYLFVSLRLKPYCFENFVLIPFRTDLFDAIFHFFDFSRIWILYSAA